MRKPVRSKQLFTRACQVLPGGVDSPVRAFQAVGGAPLFVRRASGAVIEDVDGNRFIDYVMSWGPLIHGHAPTGLVRAVARAAVGAPGRAEVTGNNRRTNLRTIPPPSRSAGRETAQTDVAGLTRLAYAFPPCGRTPRTRLVRILTERGSLQNH